MRRLSEQARAEVSEFVATQQTSLVRWAYLLTGNQSAAQDLTQQALERTCAAWTEVRDKDRPGAYVRRSILSLYLNERRRASRAELTQEKADQYWGRSAPTSPTHTVDQRIDLTYQLSTLTRLQRACIVLRYYDDLPVRDIAEHMRMSESAAKTHLSRALAHLREFGRD